MLSAPTVPMLLDWKMVEVLGICYIYGNFSFLRLEHTGSSYLKGRSLALKRDSHPEFKWQNDTLFHRTTGPQPPFIPWHALSHSAERHLFVHAIWELSCQMPNKQLVQWDPHHESFFTDQFNTNWGTELHPFVSSGFSMNMITVL